MNKSNKKSKREMSILPGAEVGVRVVKTKRKPNGDIELALKSLKKELKVSGEVNQLHSVNATDLINAYRNANNTKIIDAE